MVPHSTPNLFPEWWVNREVTSISHCLLTFRRNKSSRVGLFHFLSSKTKLLDLPQTMIAHQERDRIFCLRNLSWRQCHSSGRIFSIVEFSEGTTVPLFHSHTWGASKGPFRLEKLKLNAFMLRSWEA
ncbi:hypothetical protein CEXT_157751 [Caerostris extrusa]|uniref:Uncharacterized protein n=1 Tax=Caerostris extrusa TaxID=172846 RepID=A0AAV4PQ21_CAEEX|nr:hypothetical protein CEXT_157751 [Caerostris extrusa]